MKFIRYLSLYCTFLFLLHSCGNPRRAPVTEIPHASQTNPYNSAHALSKQKKSKRSHIHVKKGDTLYSIGFNHNIDYKTLAKINHIPAPYRIYPGQRLSLIPKNHSSQKLTTKAKEKPKTNSKAQLSTVSPITKTPKTTTISKPKVIKQQTKIIKPSTSTKKPPQNAPVSNSRWIWPVKGRLLRSFSASDISRKGIDISIRHASPVYASNNGTVVYSGDGLRGYGQLIIIKHSNNLLSAYAHNSKRLVKEGQTVRQGQEIAFSGKGTDGTNLLHFEIRKNGKPVNPTLYLPKL